MEIYLRISKSLEIDVEIEKEKVYLNNDEANSI